MAPLDRRGIRTRFLAAVNMTADELEDWLETTESRAVGFKSGAGAESVGHAAGRRIVAILRSDQTILDDEDHRLMRKAVGLVRRLRAQEPANMVTSRWRYALMNWGHDPLR